MSKRMNILVAVAFMATLGVVGCGGSKATDPGDTVPPSAVSNLDGWAIQGQDARVNLSWKPGPELDLAGYAVYRSEDGGSAVQIATVSDASYSDDTVGAGKTYQYEVAAVDTSDNEGLRASSDEFTIHGLRADENNIH